MKPGRNDACSCGSGQKYKKCCLPKEQSVQADDLEYARLRAIESQLIPKIATIYSQTQRRQPAVLSRNNLIALPKMNLAQRPESSSALEPMRPLAIAAPCVAREQS